MMVFVPTTPAAARALRAGEQPGRLPGFAVTPSLVRVLGPDHSGEEADFAALSAAGLAALQGPCAGRRLVLAVDVATDRVDDGRGEPGEVRVDGLVWRQVSALFADEDAAADAVRAAVAEVTAAPPDDALSGRAVAALSDTYDLLWYAPDELDSLG